MHREDGEGGEEFKREVAVRDRIERIRGRPVEAEGGGGHAAVDREGGAGEGGRAERAFVQPPARIGEAAAVARQHLDIGEQVMPERHRLGGLQMGEARHDGGRVFGRAVGQRAHQLAHLAVETVDRVAHPEAEIGRHLVVAAARGVQPAPGLADARDQPGLDIGVDVLERGIEGERPLGDRLGDLGESGADRRLVLGGDDSHRGEHAGMGEAAFDILPPEPLIEPDRGIDRLHHGCGTGGKSSAPLQAGWLRSGLIGTRIRHIRFGRGIGGHAFRAFSAAVRGSGCGSCAA
jgi:hypothetical protein